jgi:hypothetical protein
LILLVLDLSATILANLESAGKPLTIPELGRRCGQEAEASSLKFGIQELVSRGTLHRWSKQRFWLEEELAVLESEARKLIRNKPLWKSNLSNQLAKTGWGSTQGKRDAVFDRLKRSRGVHTWPRHGTLRGDSLCLKETDLSFYLGKLRKEYDRLAKKLVRAGVAGESIAEAVCGTISEPPPAPQRGDTSARKPQPVGPPGGEAEEDFQRDVCEQLVFAWRESGSDETRRSIEQAMFNCGLRRFGAPGQKVKFDGLAHESADIIFPGEKAIIETPGWKLDRRGRSRVLIKAQVKS